MEKLRQLRWELFQQTLKAQFAVYRADGRVRLYDDALIRQLRGVYYLGVPASVILLSRDLCNGHCRARAALLAQAFLRAPDDVRLVTAEVNDLTLNPLYQPGDFEHCFVERVTTDGRALVYDTSDGYVYDKDAYWALENPRVTGVQPKADIIQQRVKFDYLYRPVYDCQFAALAGQSVRKSLADGQTEPTSEPYAALGLLQRELHHFKKLQHLVTRPRECEI